MIEWNSIKRTEGLTSLYEAEINESNTSVVINGYTIPISENGIDVEWWQNNNLTEQQLKEILPENIRRYINLASIHQEKGGILGYVFEDHTVNNMVREEIIDWLSTRGLQPETTETQTPPSIDMVSTPESDDSNKRIISIAKFFGVSEERINNREFEECMNKLMGTEHDDSYYLGKLFEMGHITDLGDPKNISELKYVESKLIKFILIDPKEISKCFDYIYVDESFCQNGMSTSSIEILGYLLKMNTENNGDEGYLKKLGVVSDNLLKYMPDVVAKVIEISEYYEKDKCEGKVHKNTLLLKQMHKNLTEKSNQLDFKAPDLGFMDFFKDFEENIVTKVILLIFIAFIISQVLSLFKVQYNVNN
jgi:hypothetical protein